MMHFFLIATSAILLSACGEIDQSSSKNRHMPDVPPSAGAKNVYVSAGWTPGDKASWEKQLRERGQNQNEYVKTN